jgi:hypothetical protein
VAVVAQRSEGGVDLELELERDDLLPGRLVPGKLRLAFRDEREIRGAYATLIGTEHWQYTERSTDSQGHTHTRTVTAREELPRVPVRLSGPATFATGQRVELPFELPVPALGPPTVEATVAGVSWELEVKLDVPMFDPGVVMPVRVLQPSTLLRAGVVDVGQFGLWELADAEADGARATIALEPMPLCVGAPFKGRITIDTDDVLDLQEVRVELGVRVEATVGSGLEETCTLWVGRVAGPGSFGGTPRTIEFEGTLPSTFLPTARLPHGRVDATFRVVLAKACAVDPNLVRDVAICSTTEI